MNTPITPTAPDLSSSSLTDLDRIDAVCDRFEDAWRAGGSPRVEDLLDTVEGPSRRALFRELLALELELRRGSGQSPREGEYLRRFPREERLISEVFESARDAGAPRSPGAADGHEPATSPQATLPVDAMGSPDPPRIDGALGRVLGEYQILEVLGRGGMGTVYRAIQRNAGRFVALKVIQGEWWGESTEGASHESRNRFQNEARALARLEHDHIVPVYEVGHADGVLYFSMRLIRGRTLAQIVRAEGPLPPRRAAYYVEKMARAIAYAHDSNVLHRDVKPSNVMVDEQDRPWVLDFGLAKCLDTADSTSVTGQVLGTPEYMAPEQALGERVTSAADVHGLGALLYTLLTGRPPFHSPNRAVVLHKVIHDDAIWPRGRQARRSEFRELRAICEKCLEKRPADRFASATDVAEALDRYLKYERTGVTRPGPLARLSKWCRRKPWRAAAVGTAAAAALAMSATGIHLVQSERAMAAARVRDLLRVPHEDLPRMLDELAPRRGWVEPLLRERLRQPRADPADAARLALALLPWDPEQVAALGRRLLECGPEEHRVLRQALRARGHASEAAARIRSVFEEQTPTLERSVRGAAALAMLEGANGSSDASWGLLANAPDPGPRVELVDFLARSRAEVSILAERLDREGDATIRGQIAQVLAALGEGRPPAGADAALIRRFVDLYATDPDPAAHASLAHLLLRWGREVEARAVDARLAGQSRGTRRWFVSPSGLTFALIDLPPGSIDVALDEETLGNLSAPAWKPGALAVCTTEMPLALFHRLDPTQAGRRLRAYSVSPPLIPPPTTEGYPADAVSFYEAARFCNDLSASEGIPPEEWCYVDTLAEDLLTLAPDYRSRRGYRLPTVAEWEYLARAGTTTDRYFGSNPARVDPYAWHRRNTQGHAHAVAASRPNDFGLFDMIGNVMEWCQAPEARISSLSNFLRGAVDCIPGSNCYPRLSTSLKGGGFYFDPSLIGVRDRFAGYKAAPPRNHLVFAGFRVVKNAF